MRNTQYGCAWEVQRAREKRIELAGSESLATGKCAETGRELLRQNLATHVMLSSLGGANIDHNGSIGIRQDRRVLCYEVVSSHIFNVE